MDGKNKKIIILSSIAAAVLVLGGVGLWMYMRKRKQDEEVETTDDGEKPMLDSSVKLATTSLGTPTSSKEVSQSNSEREKLQKELKDAEDRLKAIKQASDKRNAPLTEEELRIQRENSMVQYYQEQYNKEKEEEERKERRKKEEEERKERRKIDNLSQPWTKIGEKISSQARSTVKSLHEQWKNAKLFQDERLSFESRARRHLPF
jgi:transposase